MTFVDLPTRPDPRFILTTDNLRTRPIRQPDLEAEAAIMREVTRVVADDPASGIRRFLDLAMELCGAGSAGLSTLAKDAEGNRFFHWDTVTGVLAPFAGATTPVDYSPCSLCLAEGKTILIERPERVFTYFPAGAPEIVEGLIVPLYDASRTALGTLWIASHDDALRFDAETARRMEMLAPLLVLALRLRAEKARHDRLIEGIFRPTARP